MLTKKVKSDIAAHVAACLPEEACGLVVMVGRKQVFVPCLNVFEDPTGVRSRKDAFTISDMAWMDAEDMGDVVRAVISLDCMGKEGFRKLVFRRKCFAHSASIHLALLQS